ncbi:MAG TPA: hypothetical protein VIU62_11195 [Chloroflexota bacterium]
MRFRRRRLRRAISVILLIVFLLLLADALAVSNSGRAGLTIMVNSLASVTAQGLLSQPAALAQLHVHVEQAHTDLQRADLALTSWPPAAPSLSQYNGDLRQDRHPELPWRLL